MNLSETINVLNSKNSNFVKQKAASQQADPRKIAAEGDDKPDTPSTTGGVGSVDDTPTTTLTNGTDEVKEQFDTFLRLLTAQIKNQDPLAPLDSTQFVEQLATFSGLELQAKGNQSLEQITNLLQQQGAITRPS